VAVKRYELYFKDDLGYRGEALSEENLDGEWVRFEDAHAQIRELQAQVDCSVAPFELQIKNLRDELTAVTLERDALKGQLTKAVEVIEWKSLYQKAEMGWYAEALVSEIKGEPVSNTGWHGQQWYAHYSRPITKNPFDLLTPHGGSGEL
jgi:hypothetical protein